MYFIVNVQVFCYTVNVAAPSTFGADLPPENSNGLNDEGFEVKLGTSVL